MFFGHSNNRGGRSEPLSEHLHLVSQRAREFAQAFGASEQAAFAGMLHDLGKYFELFQKRLRGEEDKGCDHWTLGALRCASEGGRFVDAPALAVQGHHIGLQLLKCESRLRKALEDTVNDPRARATGTNSNVAAERLNADGLSFAIPTPGLDISRDRRGPAGRMLDVRMLFSALVDADFVETEAHFAGTVESQRVYRPQGLSLDPELAILELAKRLANVRDKPATASVREVRESLLSACVTAGQREPTGLFNLTAPTGAGKTLAMLAFALHHAKKHGLRRIVLAMPFLNIVDQTALVYSEVFGGAFPEHFVLEQHSLVEGAGKPDSEQERADSSSADACDENDRTRRLLAENWDAPIVLTTTISLLESLHSNKPSKCRKLHRLAKSVILLDEVQTIPRKLTPVTLATLSRLADPSGPYGSSVVFSTATQPAYEFLQERVKSFYTVGWTPTPIVADPGQLFSKVAGRTQIEWRDQTSMCIDELADQVMQSPRVLCIVNLKRQAIDLVQRLQDRNAEGVFHLSTNMCPAHRREVLGIVKSRLEAARYPAVRLVATQCVEAGVDLDFQPMPGFETLPVLYRMLAPLESIAQAVGRANRGGLSEFAKVVVFTLPDDGRKQYPPGYEEGLQGTMNLLKSLRGNGRDPDAVNLLSDPDRIRAYYKNIYVISGQSAGALEAEKAVVDAVNMGSFVDVAKRYRLIDQDGINVVVPHDRKLYESLRQELDERSDNTISIAAWIRRARPLTVSLFRPDRNSSIWPHLEPINVNGSRSHREDKPRTAEESWFWPLEGMMYDPLLGLRPPDDGALIS